MAKPADYSLYVFESLEDAIRKPKSLPDRYKLHELDIPIARSRTLFAWAATMHMAVGYAFRFLGGTVRVKELDLQSSETFKLLGSLPPRQSAMMTERLAFTKGGKRKRRTRS